MANSETKSPEKHTLKSPFGLHVTTYVGDIIDALADAIVTAEDKRMEHASFVTKALMKRDIVFEMDREDLRKKKVSFPLWTVCSTMAREQMVYHAFLSACKRDDIKQWSINMKKLYNNLFREADKKGTLVIAMPLLGAGTTNIEEAVQIAVSSVAAHKPKTLTDVLFVSTDEDIVDQIVAQCHFEFTGRPQSVKTKRTVTFKLDNDDDEDEEEDAEKSSPRSRHKKSRLRGGGSRRRGGGARRSRRGSGSSVQSADSDDVDRTTNRSSQHGSSFEKRPPPPTETVPNYEPIDDGESSDDVKKYKTYKKMRRVRFSPDSSEERNISDDENVVRPSMKGTKVRVNGKTYAMNVKYEGSPLLKSAEDVREKVIGPPKEYQTPRESPRKESKTEQHIKPVQAVKPVQSTKPTQATKSVQATKPVQATKLVQPGKPAARSYYSSVHRTKVTPKVQSEVKPASKVQLEVKSFPKLETTPVKKEVPKEEEELESPRRTKSSELGRTRKRSQSLAAKVEEEALELLRAEHERKTAQDNGLPSVRINGKAVGPDGPEWSVAKVHSFTPQANALSNQNRSSWSSDEGDDQDENRDRSLDCPICLRVLKDPKTLEKCGHVFCTKCIDNSFANYKPVCPRCNMVYGVITGNQPEGTMDVALSDDRLPGYSRYDTIVITYSFPDGTQGPEHPDPGEPYSGTTRKAYLPNSTKGMEILRLMRTAFKRKLTFTIVRSSTDGQNNVVIWNDIHHKTSMKGGPTRFGYPDKEYLTRVKEELASKGVTE